MARPRMFDERHEVRTYMEKALWDKVAREAQLQGKSISAVIRELVETTFGQKGGV